MTQNTNPKQEQEMQENDAALTFTAAVTLGSTVVAIADAAVNASTYGAMHLPAQAETTLVALMGIGAFGMVLTYAARQVTLLRIKAQHDIPMEIPATTVEEAPVTA